MGLTRLQPGACCGCSGCNATVCVLQCSTVGVFGAVVTILQSGTTIGTCTTGSGGCCTIVIPSAGTYEVKVVVSGTTVHDANHSLTCNGTLTISLTLSNVVCCGGYAIPYKLTLTDAVGTIGFCYYSAAYNPTWYGGLTIQGLSCTMTFPGGACVTQAPSTGPVNVCYRMICYSGQSPTFAISRYWFAVQFNAVWYWFQYPTPNNNCSQAGGTQSVPCIVNVLPAQCSGSAEYATFSANPSSTSPFLLSGMPVDAGTNQTADPIGGSITISA